MTRIGTVNQRKVFYKNYNTTLTLSEDFPGENWLAFVISNDKDKTELSEISKALVENNACYVCCAGKQSELLHDIIDDYIVVKEIENGYTPTISILTTWDSDIEEALWFSIYAAHNEPAIIDTIICLNITDDDIEDKLRSLLERFKQGYIPNE